MKLGRLKLRSPFEIAERPDYEDSSLSTKARAESLEFEVDRFNLRRSQHEHWHWWFEAFVRFVLTMLAAVATIYWVRYVAGKVDAVDQPNLSASQEHILIALMTTTTANVLGSWAIVARYVWRIPEKNGETATKPKKPTLPDSDEDDKPKA